MKGKGCEPNSGLNDCAGKQPQMSGRGRHRSQDKNTEDLMREAQAKGHLHYNFDKLPADLSAEQRKIEQERGRQRGFGKNQMKEPVDRMTDHGTRGSGGERA